MIVENEVVELLKNDPLTRYAGSPWLKLLKNP
jgi:hypothetical protein